MTIRSRTREYQNAYQREWRKRNPEKRKEYKKKWHENNPGANTAIGWRRRLLRVYGITPEDYDTLYKEQMGLCALCKQPEIRTMKDGEVMRMCVDHCHTCGSLRGLLCAHCNATLGLFEKKSGIYESIITYIGGHGCQH